MLMEWNYNKQLLLVIIKFLLDNIFVEIVVIWILLENLIICWIIRV